MNTKIELKSGHPVVKDINKMMLLTNPIYLLNLKKEYGNKFWIDKYFFAFDHEYIYEIYVKQYEKFIKTGGWHRVREGIGDGLLTNEEPIHLKHRRILNPAFHVKKIESHLYKMHKIINKEIDVLSKKENFDMYKYFFDLSYNILTNTIFEDEDLNNSKHLQFIFYSVLKRVTDGENSELASYEENKEYLQNFISKIIERRLNNNEVHEDFLDLLIDSYVKETLSLDEITNEILNMMLAGHETTASTIIWAISNCYNNELILNKLKEESKIFSEKIKDQNILELCKELTYSKNIISESLRIHAPIWSSPREAIEDCIILNTEIPKGTKIIISSYVSHRDENYFQDPEKFIPERWDNNFEQTLPPGVYFPFHMGPRTCIGYRFGFLQAQITLLEFFNKMNIKLLDGFPEHVALATLRPKEGIPAEILK